MRHIGLEEIQALFQVWPEAFKNNFKRNLTKKEILDALAERSRELQAIELKTKFCTYTFQQLQVMKDFILNNEVQFVDSEKKIPLKPNVPEKQPEIKQAQDFTFTNTFKSKKTTR